MPTTTWLSGAAIATLSDGPNGALFRWGGRGPNEVAPEVIAATDGSTLGTRVNGASDAKKITDWLVVSDFGVDLPSGVTLTGVEVQTAVFVSDKKSFARTHDVYLTQSGPTGALVGSAKGPGTDVQNGATAVDTFGGDGDLWGTSLTAADVAAADFGLVFRATWSEASPDTGNMDVFVDSLLLRVHYAEDTVEPQPDVTRHIAFARDARDATFPSEARDVVFEVASRVADFS